jgi:hypothetical protein
MIKRSLYLLPLLGGLVLAACDGDGGGSDNEAPKADAGADQSVKVGAKVVVSGAKSEDPDGDDLSFAWTLKKQPQGSQVKLSAADKSQAEFTPTHAGEYELELVVNDGEESSRPDTLKVTVTEADENGEPSANAGEDLTGKVGAEVTLDGSKSADPDEDAITYLWTIKKAPEGSVAKLSSATADKPKFTPDAAGEYEFELVVKDAELSSAPDTVKLTVAEDNAAPEAKAGEDALGVVAKKVTLDGSASSDPDGDELTYSWAITAKPEGSAAAFADAKVAKPELTPDKPGEYQIELTVSDGELTSKDTLKLTIKATNAAPTANAGPDQGAVVLDSTVTLDGSASADADQGDTLRYSWTLKTKPAGSTAALNDAKAQKPTFKADKAGEYEIELVVSDGIDASAVDTVKITVPAT